MPIATPEKYAEMLDAAQKGNFAFPAINVSSSQTLNAALQGFADAGSDGIIQVSTGGAEYLSGPQRQEHGHRLGRVRGVRRARWRRTTRSTSRCTPTTAPRTSSTASSGRCSTSPSSGWRAARTRCSSRTCGTAPPYRSRRTCRSPRSCSRPAAEAKIVLEIEVGVVGGEEDGVEGAIDDKLYSTPEDALATVEALGTGENGRYLTALTFGNVHGVYKPGNVKLRPEILQNAQEAVVEKLGLRGVAPLRPGLPRRLRLDAGGDQRGGRLRRGQDERRHRHPVRLHPPGRRRTCSPTTTAC